MKYKHSKLKPEVHKKIKTEASAMGLTINDYLDKIVQEQFKPIDCNKTKKNEKKKFAFKW